MASSANGKYTRSGVPTSFTSLTPFLVLPRAKAAVEFYRVVFGAQVLGVTEMGGALVHAELDFGAGRLQLGEPSPAFGTVPAPAEGACYSLGLYCADVDARLEAALAAGATLREPIADFVSGDRYASIVDPFGIRCTIMTRIEDLSDEESAARVAAWAAEQS